MKQCPKCKQIYNDDNLNFCLIDGTSLYDDFSSASTMLMSGEATAKFPSQTQPLTSETKRNPPSLVYIGIGLLALIIGGGITFWFVKNTNSSVVMSENTSSSVETNAPPAKGELKKNVVNTDEYTLVTEVANGTIKVSYLRQDKTLKLKFANNDVAATQIKYKLLSDIKVNGKWQKFEYEATILVESKQERLDNYPILPQTEEVRNVRVEIIDWNYKP